MPQELTPTQLEELFGPPGASGNEPDSSAEPPTEGKAEESSEAQSSEEASSEEEASPEERYSQILASLESDPALQSLHQERQREREKEIAAEQYRHFQRNIQPVLDRWAQAAQETRQAIARIGQLLEKAVRDEQLTPEAVADVFRENPEALSLLNQQNWWEGAYYMLNTLGNVVGDERLANEFLARLHRLATTQKPEPDLPNDLIKRLIQPFIEREYVPKAEHEKAVRQAAEAARKAALEEIKAKAREGKGPDLTEKGVKASPSLGPRATVEELLEAELENLRKLRARR